MSTATAEYKEIALYDLKESTLNPRHHFDQKALAELTESVKAKGILQPLLVRKKGSSYEVVAGSRRYRAALAAGLTKVPCMVRELSDQEVLEAMVIENLQRVDVHPLEEAEGYKQLLAMAGKGAGKMDVTAIATKVGRSVAYIYDRVKLCALTQEAKDLFLADKFTAGHAVLLARLSPADQKRVIGTKDDSYLDGGLFSRTLDLNFTPEEIDAGAGENAFDTIKAVSVRECQAYIDDHVKFNHKMAEPMLFHETVEAVRTAAQKAEKIIQITHEFVVNQDAKDGKERIFGPRSWTRADGKHDSKTCDHAVLGVIVAGAGRGQAFEVCTDKHKCTVHWAKEIKEREKREKQGAGGPSAQAQRTKAVYAKQEQKEKEDRASQEAEQARWQKARPAILTAVAAAVKKAPTTATGLLGQIIIKQVTPNWGALKNPAQYVPLGTAAEDLVRHAAFIILADEAQDYNAIEAFPPRAKAFGIDVKKLLGPDREALKDCTVCAAKNIDPTKHVCSPAALKKAKKSTPAKATKTAPSGLRHSLRTMTTGVVLAVSY